MSRVNPLTNRKIKVGGRVYNGLIARGYRDNGESLLLPIRLFTIQGLNRTVEEDSKDYERLIELGYTPVITDNSAILEPPTPNVLVEEFKLSDDLYKDVMERVGNNDLFSYLITLPTVSVNDVSIKNMSLKQYKKFLEDLMYSFVESGDDRLEIKIVWTTISLPPHGPLFHSDEGNCVIKLIETHLANQNKANPELIEKLNTQFQNGVYHYDFDVLASKIKAKIIVSTPFSTIEYGRNHCYKQLKLSVNNNHAVLNDKESFERPIIFVDNVLDVLHEVKNDIMDYIPGAAIFTTKAIYKNRILKTENNVYDIENSEFNFYSETGYYLNKFLLDNPNLIKISTSNKNIEAIRSISKHGIHYFTESETKGETFDLKQAYTNFHQWPIYEGIPTDLDNCISGKAYYDSLTADYDILNYAGFGLIEYFDLYNNESVERWVSFPYIKMLIRQHRLYKFKYGLISRNKTNLNLSAFKDAPKRAFHKVIGRINTKTSKETYTTFDPLIAYAGGRYEHYEIESPIGSGKMHNIYSGVKFTETPTKQYFPHVAAYIQAYTEIMVEEIAFNALKHGKKILSVIVDEITLSKNETCNFKDLYIDSRFWHSDKLSLAPKINSLVHYNKAEKLIKFSNKFINILQDKGNYIKIEGGAGTGKSYIGNQIKDQIDAEICCPTNEAGQNYISNGKDYITVAKKIAMKTKTLYTGVLDEFSFNSQETYDILNTFYKTIIALGDPHQLQPVKGDMMNDSRFVVIQLDKVYRQISDPEFTRKLNILRLDCNTTEKFGTDVNESKAIELCKEGGLIVSALNVRVDRFNKLCNDGPDFKEGSRVRFIKNKRSKGYYNGLLGVIIKLNDLLIIKTNNGNFELSTHIKFIELAYALTAHKVQGKTLTHSLIYDDKVKTTFKNIRYVAYSRVTKESNLYILK